MDGGSAMSFRRTQVWLLAFLAIVAVLALCLWIRYLRIPTGVAYISEENGGISVIDLRTLAVTRRIRPADVSPRGIGVTFDGKYLITADKDTADVAIFSTPRLHLVRRIHVGDNPEFVKLDPAGQWFFTSFEPGSQGGPPGAEEEEDDENEPPAQIATFRIPEWAPGPVFTAGKDTEGLEFTRDGKLLIVANESANTLGVYNAQTGSFLRQVDLSSYGKRPRGVKRSPRDDTFAVTMEASGTLVRLDKDVNVTRSIQTAAKPYGVAFDRTGQRIFVSAAAAQRLQIYAADSLQLLAEVPIGKRCWHFTFTPDDSKILLACGRSDNIVVIDANSYQPIKTIDGFDMPWGVVTYPRSYGSLGLP
jgi:YVTN family beta-propeller protein